MVRTSEELYAKRISVMAWSKILRINGVRVCVFSINVVWKRMLLQNVAMDVRGIGLEVSSWCSKVGDYVCQSARGLYRRCDGIKIGCCALVVRHSVNVVFYIIPW